MATTQAKELPDSMLHVLSSVTDNEHTLSALPDALFILALLFTSSPWWLGKEVRHFTELLSTPSPRYAAVSIC